MSIKQWPKSERPREKLLARGAQALSDAELLALFLGTGSRGKTAVDLARDLLEEFGSLGELLSANLKQLCQIKGLGPAKSSQLLAILELARRQLLENLERGLVLNSPETTKRYFHYHLGRHLREVFCCLFLDSQHAVICCEDLFWGTIDSASVHPREVLRRVLHHNAAAVIFAHNHPSGVAEPSQADCRITKRLGEALSLIDVSVLDHIVIGTGEQISFAERGLL